MRDEEFDQKTHNYVSGAEGAQPADNTEASENLTFKGNPELRKTADSRAGRFLRQLATLNATRTLITTRLFPNDLQRITEDPITGCTAIFLNGLSNNDAFDLMLRMGISGSRSRMLDLLNRFDNYPLLIRTLAGEVSKDRRTPGDFDAWLDAHPNFTPRLDSLRPPDRKAHVLAYALRGLTIDDRRVLVTIAGFRMPASYDTLVALLVRTNAYPGQSLTKSASDAKRASSKGPHPVGNLEANSLLSLLGLSRQRRDARPAQENLTAQPDAARRNAKAFTDEAQLDRTLQLLEDRGLVGWDRRANRYDLHPIVRSVTWDRINQTTQQDIYARLSDHFSPIANIDINNVRKYEDLTPAIELYHALIGLNRYDAAYELFRDRLEDVTLFRLAVARERAELLEHLFPEGINVLPPLSRSEMQAFTLNSLAIAYHASGRPEKAINIFQLHNSLRQHNGDRKNLTIGLRNLADSQRHCGKLLQSHLSILEALGLARKREDRFHEGACLQLIGTMVTLRGNAELGRKLLTKAFLLFDQLGEDQSKGLCRASLAECELILGFPEDAKRSANHALELAHVERFERDVIRAIRLQGLTSLVLAQIEPAEEYLNQALARARSINYVEEELPTLTALATLEMKRKDFGAARELLNSVWDTALRGPYPIFHADALNVLAQLEEAQGNRNSGIKVAQNAYEKAWCDGISVDQKQLWAYAQGLKTAEALLTTWGGNIPTMPPFGMNAAAKTSELLIE